MIRGDERARALSRAADAGDSAARVALLMDRERHSPLSEQCSSCRGRSECPECASTGSPWRARLELAAYCGDADAHNALSPTCVDGKVGGRICRSAWHRREPRDISRFVEGLSRWNRIARCQSPPLPVAWVTRLAARAAQQVATHEEERRLLRRSAEGQRWEPEAITPSSVACQRCGSPLFFSARQRGSGLCGPCDRVNDSRVALAAAVAWEACPCDRHDKRYSCTPAAKATSLAQRS